MDTFTRRAPLVAYWHENMTISIINDPKSPIAKNAMQPATLKCKIYNLSFFYPFIHKEDVIVINN